MLIRLAIVVALAAMLGGCIHTVHYNPTDSGAYWSVRYEGAELGL